MFEWTCGAVITFVGGNIGANNSSGISGLLRWGLRVTRLVILLSIVGKGLNITKTYMHIINQMNPITAITIIFNDLVQLNMSPILLSCFLFITRSDTVFELVSWIQPIKSFSTFNCSRSDILWAGWACLAFVPSIRLFLY